jgi:Flp pilus assembly protein TadG
MRNMLTAIISRLKAFRDSTEAVAAVEFALIMPFMLTLYIGSIEASQLITVDRRVTTVTGTVGDLVARSDTTILMADLTNYFQAAQGIMQPFSTTGLKQVVSCVQVMADGTTKVIWSQPYNGGVARTANVPYPAAPGITPEMIAISKGSYIIIAETSYSYLPVLGIIFKTAIPLYTQQIYMPRFGGLITLT